MNPKTPCLVKLNGLQSASDLNGKEGVCIQHFPQKERWTIALPQKQILVKRENFSIRDPLDGNKSKAIQIWATGKNIKDIKSTDDIVVSRIHSWPKSESEEKQFLKNQLGWKDPQGCCIVDDIFTANGGKVAGWYMQGHGMFMFFDAGDAPDSAPENYLARHLLTITPQHKLQQIERYPSKGIRGSAIIVSAPHMGWQEKNWSLKEIKSVLHYYTTDEGQDHSKATDPRFMAGVEE